VSPPAAQYAVALATMNVVQSRPHPNVCRTVLRSGRYIWVRDHLDEQHNLLMQYTPHGHNWVMAQQIAKKVLKGQVKDFTGGATHFYATYIDPPYWTKGATFTGQWGTIRFYTDVQ
jgi:spore germination cell wall hydrolase CwlJ-like protein